MTVRIINYGGIITDILLPDKNGKVVDINLGFDDIKGIFELQNQLSLYILYV